MSTDVRAIIAAALTENWNTFEQRADVILVALAEHGVEVVADLPDVSPDGVSGVSTPAAHRSLAAWHLGAARHLESEPDPADVAALVGLIPMDAQVRSRAELARDLLRAGLRLPEDEAAS